jgi:integrase
MKGEIHMGRRNGPSLQFQVVEAFNQMKCFGQSRHDAKHERREAGEESPCRTPGIYSISTINAYTKHGIEFARWSKETHGCKTLDAARQYVPEYLKVCVDRYKAPEHSLSAWTIHLKCAAISKLYGTGLRDWGVELPERKREDITRSRNPEAVRDRHFSQERNADVVAFLNATGLRRSEAEKIRPENVSVDGCFLIDIKGKGGKIRNVEVLAGCAPTIRAITDKAIEAGHARIFGKITDNLDIHAIRGSYAKAFYQQCVETGRTEYHGNKSSIYHCRKDLSGTVYLRGAMLEVSRQLGHEREDIIALSYLGS